MAAAVLSNINISVSDSFPMPSQRPLKSTSTTHQQHQSLSPPPPAGTSSRSQQPSHHDSPSTSTTSPAASPEPRPRTFKRIRSTLEQSLRIPSRSKAKSPIPPTSGDEEDPVSNSTTQRSSSSKKQKGKGKEKEVVQLSGSTPKDKSSKSSTVFKRVTFGKSRDAVSPSPGPSGPDEFGNHTTNNQSSSKETARNGRKAGFTSFITPSLRQASISTPALHLSSQAMPSPKSQSAAIASSSSTADVLVSPTRERAPRIAQISGPTPLASSRREGRTTSFQISSPPPRDRESRHRPTKSVPVASLASSSTPGFASSSSLSSPPPSTPTRPSHDRDSDRERASSPPNTPGTPTPTSRGRMGTSRAAAQSSGHLPLDTSAPVTPTRNGSRNGGISPIRARSPSVRTTTRVVSPTSPSTRGLVSASASHLPLSGSSSSPPPAPLKARRPSVDEARRPSLEQTPRKLSLDVTRRPSVDSPRRTSFDLSPRPTSPSSPTRARTRSPTQRAYFQNRHFNVSSSSLSPSPVPAASATPEQRELLRNATSLMCKEVKRASVWWGRNERDVEEVERRMGPLMRMERVWGKSAGAANGSVSNLASTLTGQAQSQSSSGLLTSGGEERERKAFTEALRDGYVLCQLMNKLRSSSVVKPDPRQDGIVNTSNVTKFLASCSSLGLASEDLFQQDDLLEASSESLARVAHTVITLFTFVSLPTPDRSKIMTGQNARGTGQLYSGSSRAAASTPNLIGSTPSSPVRKRWSPSGLPTVVSDTPSEGSSVDASTRDEDLSGGGQDVFDSPSSRQVKPIKIMSPPPRSPLRARPRRSEDQDSDPMLSSSLPSSSSPSSPLRASIADSTIANAGTSIRDSVADSYRQSVASSAITESTTYSSLLEPTRKRSVSGSGGNGNNNKYGTIRTMTTDATSEYPSFSRTEGSSIAASLDDELGQLRPTEYATNKRERRLSETAPDLMRVVEEVEESGASTRGHNPSRPPAIFLGKGKWPDDFIDAASKSKPAKGTTRPIAIPNAHVSDPSDSSSSTPPSSSVAIHPPRKLAIVGGARRSENGEPVSAGAAFPRRPSHRARHSIDTPSSSLLPKESILGRDASPDGFAGPKVMLRRHSTKQGMGRNGFGRNHSREAVVISNGNASGSGSSESPVPFPMAESSQNSPVHSDDANAERPRLIRGRFKSEVDGESTRRKPRPSSYDELGARPTRSRFESMVNLGVSTSNEKASDILSTDGNVVRKTLIVREEGKLSTHYQLGNAIGRGQFGTVYRALNLNTGQMVAVKRIPLDGLKEEEITQLMKEVDLVKSLSHPSIVKYEGMARDQDALSIVLEYAENGSLGQLLKAFGKLNEKLVASYVVKILEGLHYLHQSDVVHCDLKAANILTTKNGNVKLSDFGVSLNMRAMERQSNNVAGTPNWMAPEVIELKGASPKSDIWSLGCTVVELLTGRPPYADLGGNTMSVMYAIVEDESAPIPEGLSPLLEDFLLQCFDKDPSKRPDAETLCEHPWVKKNWAGHKEIRPQDSIPFLRRVSADYQKSSEVVRYLSQLETTEVAEEQPVSASPTKHRQSSSSHPASTHENDMSPRDHNFVKTTFSKPMTCRVCFLNVKKNAVLCAQCSLIAHSKCAVNAPPTCDLRAQLLLYAQYAEKGNPSSAYSNPIDALTDALPRSPVSDVSYIAGSPRTSIDAPSTYALPSPPTPVHPPTAFKFLGLGGFKRSRSNLHTASDSGAASSAPFTSPALERSPPQAADTKLSPPLASARKLKKASYERPSSLKSETTQGSSMRSAATARDSFSSKQGTARRSLLSVSETAEQTGPHDATTPIPISNIDEEDSIPGALPTDTRRHKRHRDSKSSSGNCSVQ